MFFTLGIRDGADHNRRHLIHLIVAAADGILDDIAHGHPADKAVVPERNTGEIAVHDAVFSVVDVAVLSALGKNRWAEKKEKDPNRNQGCS